MHCRLRLGVSCEPSAPMFLWLPFNTLLNILLIICAQKKTPMKRWIVAHIGSHSSDDWLSLSQTYWVYRRAQLKTIRRAVAIHGKPIAIPISFHFITNAFNLLQMIENKFNRYSRLCRMSYNKGKERKTIQKTELLEPLLERRKCSQKSNKIASFAVITSEWLSLVLFVSAVPKGFEFQSWPKVSILFWLCNLMSR